MPAFRAFASLFVGFVALASIGCAPAEDETVEDADGALAFGSRFRSPLEPGIYDDGESSVRIFAELTTQKVQASLLASGIVGQGEVDVTDGVASVVLSGSRTGLQLTQVGVDQLRVEGTSANGKRVAVTLTRRERNAWKGVFLSPERPDARLTLHASDDDALAFSLLVGDLSRAYAVADADYDGYRSTIEGCSFRIVRRGVEVTLGSTSGPCDFLPKEPLQLH